MSVQAVLGLGFENYILNLLSCARTSGQRKINPGGPQRPAILKQKKISPRTNRERPGPGGAPMPRGGSARQNLAEPGRGRKGAAGTSRRDPRRSRGTGPPGSGRGLQAGIPHQAGARGRPCATDRQGPAGRPEGPAGAGREWPGRAAVAEVPLRSLGRRPVLPRCSPKGYQAPKSPTLTCIKDAAP